jgi:hypothetical protein
VFGRSNIWFCARRPTVVTGFSRFPLACARSGVLRLIQLNAARRPVQTLRAGDIRRKEFPPAADLMASLREHRRRASCGTVLCRRPGEERGGCVLWPCTDAWESVNLKLEQADVWESSENEVNLLGSADVALWYSVWYNTADQVMGVCMMP